MRDKKTLLAMKIRTGDTVHQIWALTKIILFVAALIGLVGFFRVIACKQRWPQLSMSDCLFPALAKGDDK